ncbi:MAG: tol-pal system protein YbgF [Desulfobacteraceae bacterium]|nr:tol-pal system protein YbgF [Desulfobacteraceae bacterium]
MKNNLLLLMRYSVIILFCLFLTSCTALQNLSTSEFQTLRKELDIIKKNQKQLKKRVQLQEKIIQELKNEQTVENKKLLKKEVADVKKIAYTEPILLYKEGRSALIEEEYNNAIKLFSEFLERYPHNDLADNALYWIGECYYAVTDFEKAIEIFKKVVEKYPRGMKVPDALLKTAYSYFSLKDKNRAHHYLKLVVEKYPFSEASEKAQIKLKTFQ